MWWTEYFGKQLQPFVNSSCGSWETIDVGLGQIAILPINTAIFSADDLDHQKLWVGRRSLDAALASAPDGATLRIAMMHHPTDWLHPAEALPVRASLRASFDLILHGHLHEATSEHIFDGQSGAVQLAAGATYQTRRYPNTASIVRVEHTNISVLPIRFADRPTPRWHIDPTMFPDAQRFEGRFARQSRQKARERDRP